MDDFIEFDNEKKTVKLINLDDFSVEDLTNYIQELDKEKNRVEQEIAKKKKLLENAKKFFEQLFSDLYTFISFFKSCNLTF